MKYLPRLSLVLALGLATPALADEARAGAVLECLRNAAPAAVRVQDFELETRSRDTVVQRLSGKLYVQRTVANGGAGATHAMLRVDAPEALAGAAYLVRETDDYLRDGMYVYLPSVRRVRRVTGTFADGALFGSSFSYYDFKQLTQAFGDLSARHAGEETIEGRATDRLRFAPLPGVETRYTEVEAWVDRETCLPLRAEFRTDKGPVKRLSVAPAALRRYGERHWYASESSLMDLEAGTTSVLRITNVSGGDQLPKRYFDPNLFFRGI